MKCLVLQTRRYNVIGLRHTGDVVSLPDDLAKQLIAQGFLKPYGETKKPKKAVVHSARGGHIKDVHPAIKSEDDDT